MCRFQPWKQQIFSKVNELEMNGIIVQLKNVAMLLNRSASHPSYVTRESLSQHSLCSISAMIQTPLIQPPTHTHTHTQSWGLGMIITHHHITPGDASANVWAHLNYWEFCYELQKLFNSYKTSSYLNSGKSSVWNNSTRLSACSLCVYGALSALYRCLAFYYLSYLISVAVCPLWVTCTGLRGAVCLHGVNAAVYLADIQVTYSPAHTIVRLCSCQAARYSCQMGMVLDCETLERKRKATHTLTLWLFIFNQ